MQTNHGHPITLFGPNATDADLSIIGWTWRADATPSEIDQIILEVDPAPWEEIGLQPCRESAGYQIWTR